MQGMPCLIRLDCLTHVTNFNVEWAGIRSYNLDYFWHAHQCLIVKEEITCCLATPSVMMFGHTLYVDVWTHTLCHGVWPHPLCHGVWPHPRCHGAWPHPLCHDDVWPHPLCHAPSVSCCLATPSMSGCFF